MLFFKDVVAVIWEAYFHDFFTWFPSDSVCPWAICLGIYPFGKWTPDCSLNCLGASLLIRDKRTVCCEIQSVIWVYYIYFNIWQYTLLKYEITHMYFIFSLIKINHPFLRILSFLGILMIYNTDSGVIFTYLNNFCLHKVKEKYFQQKVSCL